MAGVQEMPADMDGKERILLARYERAKRQAQEQWYRRRGVREAQKAVTDARVGDEYVPLWIVSALAVAQAAANKEYGLAMDAETAAMAELSKYVDDRLAAALDGAAKLAAGAVTE